MSARELALGKWRGVLTALGIPEKSLDGHHHACPGGDGKDRFRFADRNGTGSFFCKCSDGNKGGMALLMCCNRLSYADAAKAVESVAGEARETPARAAKDPRIALRKIQDLVQPVGFQVARYLKERGLKPAPGLRQARLAYWNAGQKIGIYDTMIGVVRASDGSPLTFHITYLDGAKKAEVPAPRKLITPVQNIAGGAIRLYPQATRIGVSEGIETAIAAHMLHNVPVWAVVSAHGMETFIPPDGIDEVTIYGDTDASYTGQSAAFVLAKRLTREGRRCEVLLPDSGDWNDELRRRNVA